MEYQFEVLAGKIEDVASVADRVEEVSGQMDQLQRMVQQVVDNSKPAAVAAASNVNGSGRCTRACQMQKLDV